MPGGCAPFVGPTRPRPGATRAMNLAIAAIKRRDLIDLRDRPTFSVDLDSRQFPNPSHQALIMDVGLRVPLDRLVRSAVRKLR